jgi:hypothetical protein
VDSNNAQFLLAEIRKYYLLNLTGEEKELQIKIDQLKKCLKDCGIVARVLSKDSRTDTVQKLEEMMAENSLSLTWSAKERADFKRINENEREIAELKNTKFKPSDAKHKKAKVDASQKAAAPLVSALHWGGNNWTDANLVNAVSKLSQQEREAVTM